jgi:hypothetical protein
VAVTVSVCERSKHGSYTHVENQNLTTVAGGGHVAVAWVTISILSSRGERKLYLTAAAATALTDATLAALARDAA